MYLYYKSIQVTYVCVHGRKCLQHMMSKGVNILNIEKKTPISWKYKNSPVKKR